MFGMSSHGINGYTGKPPKGSMTLIAGNDLANVVFRLLYAIFILNNLLTITYGVPPLVSIIQDGEVQLPDDESLWNAPTEEQWRQRLTVKQNNTPPSLKDAVTRLMYGKEFEEANDSSWNWSPFTATVVMHTVSVQLWHVMQCTQSFSVFAVQVQMQDSLKSLFAGQVETALARCRAMITYGRLDSEQTWNESEGPFFFNCLALLRVAYVRAFTGTGSFDRITLLSDDSEEILRAIGEYVRSPQSRSPFLTRAVARAFEGFLTPIKAGALLVQKTAALNWSIEHAIAGWDCGEFYPVKPLSALNTGEIPTTDHRSPLLYQMDPCNGEASKQRYYL